MHKNLFSAAAVALLAVTGCAPRVADQQAPQHGASLPVAVYERAEAFLPENLGALVKGERLTPRWREDGALFWFEADTADGRRFVLTDPDRGESQALFDHEALAAKLTEASGETVDATDLSLRGVDYDFETEALSFWFEGQRWSFARDSLRQVEAPVAGLSPDGRWRVFIRDHDLYLEDMASGDIRRLTTDGSAQRPYARPLVNPRRMVEAASSTPELDADIEWSPDSRRFASYRMNLEGARTLSLVESTPPDGAPPIAYEYVYPLTGDSNVPTAQSFIIDAASGARVAVGLPPQDILYYYGPSFVWTGDSEEVTQLIPARGYGALRLHAIDAASGVARVLAETSSDTFVDYYDHSWTYLDRADAYFWLSEATGWHHGYLVTRDGRRHALTRGEWRVHYLAGATLDEDNLFVVGSGREPDRDPYLRHLYRVNRDGGEPLLLTPEALDHDVSVSPDGRYFVDNMSLIDEPTRSVLRSALDGEIIMQLQAADTSALDELGYRYPQPFETVAADGRTPIYGAIYRPSDFDPSRRYAVIENIYTGPHYVMAPKSFTAGLTGRNAASIAELGFIVVLIDGRGSSGRSRDFLAHAYRNLHEVGLDDHIAGIRALAESYPYMDLSRVGVYGFSAGGYDVVRAMTRRPDFYTAGVSASGNHDNRLDKAIWNEQWMGLPLGPHYDDNSNVTWANKLEGKLFLAHGELDENVPPLATRRLIDALIKANKDFEYLIVPGAGHFLDNSDYFNRRRWDFFVRSLRGMEPPPAYQINGLSAADRE